MTAVAAIIASLAALVTALTGLAVVIPQLRKIHVLVNSNLQSMLRREEVLIAALQQHGITIPRNEALHKEAP